MIKPLALNPSLPRRSVQKIPPEVRPQFSDGNAVTALAGAREIFPRVREMIRGAQKSVEVEMMDVAQPEIVDLLVAQARQGRRVDVLVQRPDGSLYSAPRAAAMKRLRAAGVHVHQTGKNEHLDHVKLLIVDGRAAVIGGMNWGIHSAENHDDCVEIEGPAVNELEELFARHFRRQGVAPLKPQPRVGNASVNVLITDRGHRPHDFGRNLVRAIDTARTSIHAELYALTDASILDALINAHARGVQVQIIVDPLRIGDHSTNLEAVEHLKRNGIEVRWYRCNLKTAEKMHAKLALFDRDQVIVGSANWSAGGRYQNREADVEVMSPRLERRFEEQFQQDWHHRTTLQPIYRV
ncbi:MAG: phospholipase D-like domain-containing protein [Candidatus Xenobia bacterium]